mmetsp:Transcript_71743/g.207841  ORF Transcript_71743/g.207841 Transcript_71743/m.207841 type:complete len:274 (-) Transcript_71743:1118-1939(-)
MVDGLPGRAHQVRQIIDEHRGDRSTLPVRQMVPVDAPEPHSHEGPPRGRRRSCARRRRSRCPRGRSGRRRSRCLRAARLLFCLAEARPLAAGHRQRRVDAARRARQDVDLQVDARRGQGRVGRVGRDMRGDLGFLGRLTGEVRGGGQARRDGEVEEHLGGRDWAREDHVEVPGRGLGARSEGHACQEAQGEAAPGRRRHAGRAALAASGVGDGLGGDAGGIGHVPPEGRRGGRELHEVEPDVAEACICLHGEVHPSDGRGRRRQLRGCRCVWP